MGHEPDCPTQIPWRDLDSIWRARHRSHPKTTGTIWTSCFYFLMSYGCRQRTTCFIIQHVARVPLLSLFNVLRLVLRVFAPLFSYMRHLSLSHATWYLAEIYRLLLKNFRMNYRAIAVFLFVKTYPPCFYSKACFFCFCAWRSYYWYVHRYFHLCPRQLCFSRIIATTLQSMDSSRHTRLLRCCCGNYELCRVSDLWRIEFRKNLRVV